MKERTPAQIIRDCVRCENAKTKVCRCKCEGKHHGKNRESNHPIGLMLTAEQIALMAGVKYERENSNGSSSYGVAA